MRILVIKQSAFGDVLNATGHLSAVRENFPTAHLVVLTSTNCAALLRNHPAIDELFEFDRDLFRHQRLQATKAMLRLIRRLRLQQFDLAIDLQGRARSAIFLYCSRAKKKFVKGNFPLLKGFKNKSLHAIDEMSEVLRLAGLSVDKVDMTFPISRQDHESLDRILSAKQISRSDSPYIVISPFSTHPAKDWPLHEFSQFIQKLLAGVAAGHRVYLTGTADRADQIRELEQQLHSPQVTSLVGQLSVNEFAALTNDAALVVSADSFPMHLAAALQTPLLSFFGPTRESQVGPRGTGPTVVLRAENCDGCRGPRHCHRHCLSEIPSSRMVEAAQNLLSSDDIDAHQSQDNS